MNSQEIFDKVANHLFTQKAQSANAEGSCMYRGYNGRMCAVGALIADEAYDQSLENRRANASIVIKALLKSGVIESVYEEEKVKLLTDLQDIHDFFMPLASDTEEEANRLMEEVKLRLKKLAEDYNLKVNF